MVSLVAGGVFCFGRYATRPSTTADDLALALVDEDPSEDANSSAVASGGGDGGADAVAPMWSTLLSNRLIGDDGVGAARSRVYVGVWDRHGAVALAGAESVWVDPATSFAGRTRTFSDGTRGGGGIDHQLATAVYLGFRRSFN